MASVSKSSAAAAGVGAAAAGLVTANPILMAIGLVSVMAALAQNKSDDE